MVLNKSSLLHGEILLARSSVCSKSCKRSLITGGLVLFASVLMLIGCSKKELSNIEQGAVDQVLHYANGDEPSSIDPYLTTGTPDNNIIINLFEGLVSKDHKTLEPKPGVAESWTISEDGKTYVFSLRKEARWSNGDPVTSKDFIFSYKRALMPKLPNQYAYMMFYLVGAKDYYEGKTKNFDDVGLKAPDDHTLIFQLNHANEFFLQLLDHHSFYPVHKATLEKFGAIDDASSKWVLPGNFVGNGPFVLEDWQVNKVITLRKSDTYWDKDKVKLNRVHIYPIDDQQAEERAFRSGKVHLTNTPSMDIEKVVAYRNKKSPALRIVPTYSSYYYEINTSRKGLDDPRVRKAIAFAIDRELIVNNVTKAGEVPAYSVIAPNPGGYEPTQYFDYAPEKAKQLLAEAGYPNGQGFPGFTILYNTHDNHRKVALAIQQMLNNVLNINVQIENKEWKVYMAARDNREHDVARAGWLADFVDPINFFDVFRSYSGNNHTNWGSPYYDDLILKAESATSEAQRAAFFEAANKILFDEMPVIPIYYYSDVNLVSPMVKNWHDNVMHFHPLKEVYLDSPTADTQK